MIFVVFQADFMSFCKAFFAFQRYIECKIAFSSLGYIYISFNLRKVIYFTENLKISLYLTNIEWLNTLIIYRLYTLNLNELHYLLILKPVLFERDLQHINIFWKILANDFGLLRLLVGTLKFE